MDQVSTLAAEIRAYCAAHADAKLAGKWARYFTEGYDAWGLLDKNDPFWNQKQQEWLERYRKIGLRGFLKLGELLFASGKYEEGGLAIRFVKQLRDQFDAKSAGLLGKWFEAGIGNWAHTDVLCGEVIAPLLASGRVEPQALIPWRKSPHKFQRRAVPVALLGLLNTDIPLELLLEFVRPMMMDGERVVQQGLGWFLREAWKKQAQPVEAFLLEWKDTAPRVIFQYATEKMPPAARLRFRRGGTAFRL
jgi:3-methyladenine DNA glycosylase AlkD